MISNIGPGGIVLLINIILFIVFLFFVISTAVKVGINKSVVGKYIEKKYVDDESKKD